MCCKINVNKYIDIEIPPGILMTKSCFTDFWSFSVSRHMRKSFGGSFLSAIESLFSM